MQDEVNEKVVSLCIRGGKISAQILKSAILKTLTKLEQQKSQRKQKKGVSKEEKNLAVYKGKQSMEKLKEQNCELSNIEITDGNIKSFEKYARACLKIKNCTKHVFLSPFHDRIKKKGAFICQDVMN